MKYTFFTFLTISILHLPVSAQTTVQLSAEKDNTLYESPSGGISNGEGQSLFTGRTNQNANALRRALLKFDVSSIPLNATVTGAILTLNVSKTPPNNPTTIVSAHKVTADWGEGTSSGGGQGATASTGDATWLHTFHNTSTWTTLGGDFVANASATETVSGTGSKNWASSQMQSDVSSWINNPSQNFGWIIIGEESTSQTAYQIRSRENASNQPVLSITYTLPSSCMTNLTVSGAIASGLYEASNTVTIAGSVTMGTTSTFKGGQCVQMANNAQIESGADVAFVIGPCN